MIKIASINLKNMKLHMINKFSSVNKIFNPKLRDETKNSKNA